MNKLTAIILCIAGSAAIVSAQSNKISTVVVSPNGEAVPGASVTVTGSNISTTTDINGKFTIDAPTEYKTLTISHNSYQPTTIDIMPTITMTPAKKVINGFGIELGYVSSTWSYKNSGDEETSSTGGFTLGVSYDHAIKSVPNFSIMSGLFYVPKGVSMWDGEEIYNANYIELQVLAKYKQDLPVLNNELNVFAMAGPYVAFGVGGSIDVENDPDGTFEDASTFDLYNRFDAGLTIGFGVNYRSYSLTFRYDLGLSNIFDKEKYAEGILDLSGVEKSVAEDSNYNYLKEELVADLEDISIKNRAFMITLGYRF